MAGVQEEKKVVLLQMSCPWISNRDLKDKEKSLKYAPLRVRCSIKQMFGSRGDSILRRVQKAVISGTSIPQGTLKLQQDRTF